MGPTDLISKIWRLSSLRERKIGEMINEMRATTLLIGIIFLTGCGSPESAPDAPRTGKPVVYASNYPLYYFAERIGGDFVDLRYPVEPGGDPAFWRPSNEAITGMQKADVIFLNGATYEKWKSTVTLPISPVVNTSIVFSGDYIETEGVAHTHGPGEAHSHGEIAFTTWMDLQQAIWQAEEVSVALTQLLPDKETELQKRFDTLADEIETLHVEFKKVGDSIGNTPIVASHPVYQYFARRYGLAIKSVHWEPEVTPVRKAVVELHDILEVHPAKWMLWEGQPIEAAVKMLEEKGIKSIVIDPCGNQPEEGDWMSVMRANLEQLKLLQ